MSHKKDYLKIIKPCLDEIRENDVMVDAFKKYDVDLNEIDLIPICFDKNLEVSARTDHGVIYLNDKLRDKIEEISHYLVHEITHVLQQTNHPTKGSNNSEDYLDNEAEQEGFQNQTEFISETRGDDAAKKYIDKVLEHHDVPESDRNKRMKDLLNLAFKVN